MHIAQRTARLRQLVEQLVVDVALAGLLGHQIPEVADFRLTDAVNAPEALLQPVRVPRNLVVDQAAAVVLEVDAFRRCVRRD